MRQEPLGFHDYNCLQMNAFAVVSDSGTLPEESSFFTSVGHSFMAEVLHENLAEIEASDVHKRLGLEKGKYILLSAHREENIDTEKNFNSLFTAINAMAEKYDMPILYSCHPRSRNRLEKSGFQLDPRVMRQEPLGFHDYNCLQMNAFAVVSDSGTLPEESSFFTSVGHSFPAPRVMRQEPLGFHDYNCLQMNAFAVVSDSGTLPEESSFFTSVGHSFPAVCIRTSTERPEALDKGAFILAGINTSDSGTLPEESSFFTSVGHSFPAVCIRTSTERPEALDKGAFILAGINTHDLLQAVDVAVEMCKNGDNGLPVPTYTDEIVSTKVVKLIQSYTGVVNKMVWRKGE